MDLNVRGWFVVVASFCCLTAVLVMGFLTRDLLIEPIINFLVLVGIVVVGETMKTNQDLFMKKNLYEETTVIDVTGKDVVKCPRCRLPIKVPVRTISMRWLERFRNGKSLHRTSW